MPRETWVLDLGTRDYAEIWALQKDLVVRRSRDEIPDTVIFVQHPHVITLGRKRSMQNPFRVSKLPIQVFEVERGGEATYHGPGQLVGYPILKLQREQRDLHHYLRYLEELLMQTLRDFGIVAQRKSGATGVWTAGPLPRKIASIGVAVRRWVTYHGFALNVSTDLKYFQMISPCGFDGSIMTSMERELGESVNLEDVKASLLACYERSFPSRLRILGPEVLDVKTPSVIRG